MENSIKVVRIVFSKHNLDWINTLPGSCVSTVFYVSTRQFFSFLTSFNQYFLGITSDTLPMYQLVGGSITGQVALNEYLKQVSNLKWSVKLCFGKVHSDASIDQVELGISKWSVEDFSIEISIHPAYNFWCFLGCSFIQSWIQWFLYVVFLEFDALLSSYVIILFALIAITFHFS